ncbi:hypothetical protein ABK017_005340 [Salmonella enterica]
MAMAIAIRANAINVIVPWSLLDDGEGWEADITKSPVKVTGSEVEVGMWSVR